MVAKKIKTYFIRGWHWIRQQRNLKLESPEEQQEKKYVYQKFTPYTDVDLQSYKDAFDYVFAHEDVRNVAISGTYGSGKSSLIESLKKELQNPDSNLSIEGSKYKKFLHISLAHFHYSQNKTSVSHQSNSNQSDGFNELSILESKILNQLIHQIPAEQIPQSNFVVKRIISNRNIVGITIYSFLSILFLVNIIFSEAWKEFVLSLNNGWYKYLLLVSTSKQFLLCSGIWFAISVAIFLFYTIKLQRHKNIFKKLKFQGNEIEIGIECNDSFFDKYLNEVVYVFANADADVIVFEDIDRFENRLIFERLREINTLVNYQLQQPENKNSKILRFFYLVRDDIFSTKDRTKFFDFIIPVIPVVDSSNSYNKLIEFLKQYLEEKPQISKDFLEGLSLYIDDMRLLKNICNEFHLYFTKLNNTELSANKMLALISYKNLFPQDFSSLHINQGFIFSLFNNKHIFIKKEKLKKELSDKKYLKEEKDKQINSASKQGEDEKKELVESEINHINISDLTNKKMKSILTKDNIDRIFNECIDDSCKIEKPKEFSDVKASPYFSLLKYLIRNGHIDENYTDYMTYFYPNSLTIGDKNFLLSIRNEIAKEYDYKLSNPKLITEKLHSSLYKQPEILNFDLVKYLLSLPKDFEIEIKYVLRQLIIKNNQYFMNSIWPVINKNNLKTLVRLLNEDCQEFLLSVINKEIVNKEIIKAYTVNILYFLSKDIIAETKTSNSDLRNYISECKDYLNIDEPKVELLIQQFKLQGVKFKQIEYKSANKALLSAVYQNNLYELNYANINLMLSSQYPVEKDEDIKHKNYSIIMRQPNSYLAQYVLQNINEYINLILRNCDELINDDEDHVMQILNNQNINIGHKHVYINYLRTVINNLENIENKKLWPKLISANNIACTEENILLYFQNFEDVEDGLIDFINSAKNVLNFEPIWTKDNYDIRDRLFGKIIINQNINMQKYGEILGSLGFIKFELDFDKINKDRFRILVNKEAVCLELKRFKEDSIILLKSIRENCDSNEVLYFIEKNLKDYLTLLTQDKNLFDLNEALNLIKQLKDDTNAIELLKCTEEQISVIDNSFTPAVMAFVLQHNFNTADLVNLIQGFEQYNTEIQKLVITQVNENINKISIAQNALALKFIRLHCNEENVLHYLKANLDDYLNLINADCELFNDDEALKLIDIPIDDNYAIRLLEFTNKTISVTGKKYSPIVMAYVLKHNFDIDDLNNLISDFDDYDKEIQYLIKDHAYYNWELITIKKKPKALKFIIKSWRIELVLNYLVKNIADYVDLIKENNELFDSKIAKYLFKKGINEANVIELLKFIRDSISVFEYSFSHAVMAYVLEHNFDTNDLNRLISDYESYDEKIKSLIEMQANKHINLITIKQKAQALKFITKYCDEEAVLSYLQENLVDYMDLIERDHKLFELTRAKKLISLGIDDANAIKLLGFTEDSISVFEHSFSSLVMIHVLNHNFDINDLNRLINNYKDYDIEIQYSIERLATRHINRITIKRNTLALKFIRKKCDKGAVVDYLQEKFVDYVDLIVENKELFDYEEALELIKKIDDDANTIRLMQCTSQPISIIDYPLSLNERVYVLQHNFDSNDLPDLIKNYDEYDAVIQPLILELVIKHVDLIKITQESDIADNLLKALLFSEQLTQAKKIDLFIQALPYKFMNAHSRMQALRYMQLREFNKIWSSGVPKIKVCPEYQRLLTTLKEYDLVRDFCIDANNRDYFVITKKSAKK